MKTLLGLLHTQINKVRTVEQRTFQGLLTLASTWEQNLRYLLKQHEKEVTTEGTADVVSPYTRISWSEQQRPNLKMHPPPPMERLNLATFGWWEVIPPTLENYARLEAQLKKHHVHVCTITGMPVQTVIHAIQESAEYKWYGPVTNNHQGVGQLVHSSLWSIATSIPPPEGCGNRVVVTRVGEHIIQGVYSPYVGKIPTREHKAFLAAVIDSHKTYHCSNKQAITWTMGDLNLQGIAPGQANRPKPGSRQHMMSTWMAQTLKAHELEVARTPHTHVRGSALDVHITEKATKFEARAYTMPRNLSDHKLSVVATDITSVKQAAEAHPGPERQTPVVTWGRDRAKWKSALEMEKDITSTQAQKLENLVKGLHERTLTMCDSTQLVDLATLLMHTTFTVIGHAYDLTCRTEPREGDDPPDMHTDQILEEAWDSYEQTRTEAEENPGDVELQVQCVMQWTWLHQVRQATKPSGTRSRNPKGLSKAIKGGQQETQIWLTRALKENQPTLQVNTNDRAQEVNEFRMKVSQLDSSS